MMFYSNGFCEVDEKKYKKIFSYLCNVSDAIYFTYYEDKMINKEIFELSEECWKVEVPKRILDFTDRSVVGYQVDVMICKYFFDKKDIYELFADRMWGELLFYQGEHRIAYIYEDDWVDDICIQTDDEQLIKELSDDF